GWSSSRREVKAQLGGAGAGESLVWGEERPSLPKGASYADLSPPLPRALPLSHRKLFVFLAVLICLVTSSLIVFFLFPRSIAVQPAGLNSSTVAFDEADIYLNITNILNISNSNYYPITVTQLTIEVLHLSLVVGQVTNSLLLHVGPLASEQMFYAVANKIWDENTYKICSWMKIKVHHVLLHVQGTLTCSYLSHSEQLVFQSYEYVDCRGNTSVPHVLVPHPP
uniref:Transmembrane protein 106A n=1 Tax=Ursus americanus TaxID=9643 RepID=A0A452RU42_URSAM